MNRTLKILIIGTFAPPIGGASVLLKHLVDALANRDDLEIIIVNTSGVRGSNIFKGTAQYIRVLWQIFNGVRKSDVVSLHSATSGLPWIGPPVYLMTHIWGKPLIVRKFGGTDYRNWGFIRCNLIRSVIKGADLYLAETKMLVQAAKNDGVKHVEWYPNNRPLGNKVEPVYKETKSCRRFVYMGQVRPAKGIDELIQAAERFGDNVEVDVYGPFFEGLSEKTFVGLDRTHYRGIVEPEHVVQVLSRYDAFVLPTHHKGEGYPGVVLEAYRAGIPVITTRWQALPEIVDETCGFLVEPYNANEFYEAMKKLVENDKLYARLRKGVEAKETLFSSEIWAEHFVEHCKNVAEGSGKLPIT